MLYRILADAVVFVHFLWIVFLIFGGLVGSRNKPVRALHIGGLIFAVMMQVFGWYCPLTHLEFRLRRQYDPFGIYPGSFITYYLERLIYVEVSRPLIFALTILIVGFNAFLYFRFLRKPVRPPT